jgi:16S rRNA (guanine527-N7)-methyltransferase
VSSTSSWDSVRISQLVTPLLDESARLGFIGPGPIQQHIDHALRLTDAVRDLLLPDTNVCDLGSGGGLPGLVMAAALPDTTIALLDAHRRRCEFLRTAAAALRSDDSLTVIEGRAEVVARDARYDEHFGLVVARSFGPPAAVAECAARLLRVGAALAVSEPPTWDDQRWPSPKLAALGLALRERRELPLPLAILVKVAPTPTQYPRREGVPTRRLLW